MDQKSKGIICGTKKALKFAPVMSRIVDLEITGPVQTVDVISHGIRESISAMDIGAFPAEFIVGPNRQKSKGSIFRTAVAEICPVTEVHPAFFDRLSSDPRGRFEWGNDIFTCLDNARGKGDSETSEFVTSIISDEGYSSVKVWFFNGCVNFERYVRKYPEQFEREIKEPQEKRHTGELIRVLIQPGFHKSRVPLWDKVVADELLKTWPLNNEADRPDFIARFRNLGPERRV